MDFIGRTLTCQSHLGVKGLIFSSSKERLSAITVPGKMGHSHLLFRYSNQLKFLFLKDSLGFFFSRAVIHMSDLTVKSLAKQNLKEQWIDRTSFILKLKL